MSLLEKAKFLLRKYRFVPNKLLGQNFMVEASVLQSAIDYASIVPNDVVLDIGAGFGFLTRALANKCETVLAVEADPKLANVLYEELKDFSNVKIIQGDVLKVSIPHFSKVVSIPPYNISSLLLLWLFSQKSDCAVLIFQKEFAERLVASVGSEYYGWLAVVAYYYVEVDVLGDVPKRMFYPQPEVDSVIVRLRPKKHPPFIIKNELLFKRFVQSLFTRRNRKVRNAIVPFIRGKEASDVEIVESLAFRDKRVRELAPEDFGALFNEVI